MVFLAFFISIPLMIISVVPVLFSAIQSTSSDMYSPSDKLPAKCLEYKPIIEQHINNGRILNVQEHTYILLAIMAQESKCDTVIAEDLFQASESLGLPPNSLTATESITQGVKYFAEGYTKSQELALQDVKFIIQGYNFGYGFLDFAKEKNTTAFNPTIAHDFSALKGGGYGDPDYVEHVMQYLIVQSPITTGGVFPVVPIVGENIRWLQPYGEYRDGSGSHWGIDISVGFGSNIVAAADGVVDEIHGGHCPDHQGLYASCGGGYGNGVTIRHDNGLYARYGHMQQGSVIVSVGQIVKAGQKLGLEGDSGSSTASHLHFEVRVAPGYVHADTRNPLDYIIIPGINE